MIKRIIPLIIKQQNKIQINQLHNNNSIRLFSTKINEGLTDIEKKKLLSTLKKKKEQKNYNDFLNTTNEFDNIINENKKKHINNINNNSNNNLNIQDINENNTTTTTTTTSPQSTIKFNKTNNNDLSEMKVIDNKNHHIDYSLKKEIAPGIFINPELTKADKRSVIVTCAKDFDREAIELSKKLGLDFLPLQQVLKLPNEIFQYQSVLFLQERGVSLHDFEDIVGSNRNNHVRKMTSEIFLDYTQGAIKFRTEFGKNKKSPMIRSIATQFEIPQRVLDVTGGLGKDAWIIASMGVPNVTIVERNPVLIYMIQCALQQALLDPETNEIASRITLVHQDSIEYIVENINNPADSRPQVIYMDPMYPTKKKEKSLSKKDIRAVRKLAGGDRDSTILFALSRKFATNRVVWKRPKETVPFIGSNIEYKSKDTTFYVYFAKDVKLPTNQEKEIDNEDDDDDDESEN